MNSELPIHKLPLIDPIFERDLVDATTRLADLRYIESGVACLELLLIPSVDLTETFSQLPPAKGGILF